MRDEFDPVFGCSRWWANELRVAYRYPDPNPFPVVRLFSWLPNRPTPPFLRLRPVRDTNRGSGYN